MGEEESEWRTAKQLVERCLPRLEVHIELFHPDRAWQDQIFLTNAALCLGKATTERAHSANTIKHSHVERCASKHTRPLLELIRPRAVVTLGVDASRAVWSAFRACPHRTLRELIRATPKGVEIFPGTRLFPVAHPAYWKSSHNPDWDRVRPHLG